VAKQRRYPNTVNRRKAASGLGAANRIGTRTPLVPTIDSNSGATVTLSFDQNIVLHGTPGYFDTSTPSITVNSATVTAPGVVELIFNGAVTGGFSIPFEDPSIRNMIGGYVQSGDYTFPS
jgi:hypothetical protein